MACVLFHIIVYRLSIYSPSTIENYISTLEPPYSVYAYTIPNENVDIPFSFLLFRLMLADMRLDNNKNVSHVVVIDKTRKTQELTIYRPNHKPSINSIMSYTDMVSRYGGFDFGGALHIDVIDDLQNKVYGAKIDYRTYPNDPINQEKIKILGPRTQKRLKALFSSRVAQRKLVAEYILENGTEYQKQKFSSILNWYNLTKNTCTNVPKK